jgi:hypothetical protein
MLRGFIYGRKVSVAAKITELPATKCPESAGFRAIMITVYAKT